MGLPGYDLWLLSPLNEDTYCEVCGYHVDDCICQECLVCGCYGDPRCYEEHGMVLTDEQREALAAAEDSLRAEEDYDG